jgi:hypothetical protein
MKNPVVPGNKPNEVFTTLPTKPTDDCEQGSLKIDLPTSSKYGPLKK